MMKQSVRQLKRVLLNVPGKGVGRKIVVLESDDWGSIRMPSRETYDYFQQEGLRVDRNPFNRFDALESDTDLDRLFDLLSSFRDAQGQHPVITANFAMANPRFGPIGASGFSEYSWEPFTETYERYPDHAQAFSLVQKGMEAGVFHPQFHCREHLNVPLWLQLLRAGNSTLLKAFAKDTFCVDVELPHLRRQNLMAAFDYANAEDWNFISTSITEGLNLFEQVFGFRSKSLIAPCTVWDSRVEQLSASQGVGCLQSTLVQLVPQQGGKPFGTTYRFPGARNRFGQRYTVRNCYFEPSTIPHVDWVDHCLSQMAAAFTTGKAAVICTHRLNFTGSIFPENRESGLKLLHSLLKRTLAKWPDVSFVTTDQLYSLYK